MANRTYTAAQRADAVRQVVEHGQPIGHVARDMSVGIGTIRRWIGADAGPSIPMAVVADVQTRRRDPRMPAASSNVSTRPCAG